MKRFLMALVVGAALFAVVFAAAAALGPITPNNIQAGSSVISTCDAGGVSVAWKTFVAGPGGDHLLGGFKVAGVQINDLDSACIGQKVLVALQTSPTVQVGFARGTVEADGGGAVAYCNEFYSGGGWVNGETGAGPWADQVNNLHILIKSSFVSYDG